MPTFGYTTVGSVASGVVSGDTVFGSRFTAPESGTISQITARVYLDVAGTAPMRVAVFSVGAGNTIGSLVAESSGTVNVTSTSSAWVTCPITASIVGGVDYWLFAWVDTSGIPGGGYHYVADVNAISNTISIAWANSWPSWTPTVGDGSNEAYDLAYASIYADYTPNNPLYGTPKLIGIQSITGLQSISL